MRERGILGMIVLMVAIGAACASGEPAPITQPTHYSAYTVTDRSQAAYGCGFERGLQKG